jgi:hypothetical protein
MCPQFPLYTLMVFNEWHNDVPIVHIIISNYKTHDLSHWMDASNKILLLVKAN